MGRSSLRITKSACLSEYKPVVNFHKKRIRLLVILLIGSFAIFKFMQEAMDQYGYDSHLHCGIVDFLTEKLVFEKPVPTGQPSDPSENRAILYVLGGNQRSLTKRYLKASELYHRGLSKKILVLSRPGITEFHHGLGKNLTNDEWSIRDLRRLDVKQEDIEPVSVIPGIFGTLREARRVKERVGEIGGERLILVTSSYHTRRAFLAFSLVRKEIPCDIYVYEVEDDAELINMVSEAVKLFIYENIILPACSTFCKGHK